MMKYLSPQIGTSPGSLTVSVGDPATFVVDAFGTAPLTFRWQPEIASTGLLGDEAAVEIRRASGVLESYKIKWQKSGVE